MEATKEVVTGSGAPHWSGKYELVVGLEVHAQLITASKAYSSDPNAYGDHPNTNVSVVTLGHPGTLPVLNKKVVEHAVRLGLATHCEIAPWMHFARKNYFYPDLPKGYQITQDKTPICTGGWIEIPDTRGGVDASRDPVTLPAGQVGSLGMTRIGITRIHMEEDAGKSIHDVDPFNTLVDLNRAGVPLVEIVSEPDIRSGQEAYDYLTEIRRLVRYLDICDGNMEEGSLRCDANISLRPLGSDILGSKTELKNMNSFKAVEKSLEHEIKRQRGILKNDNEVLSETLRWDESSQSTVVMRGKLQAHDYRCFADPELTPIQLTAAEVAKTKSEIPEMAEARANRFVSEYQLPEYDAAVLTAVRSLADYFESCLQRYSNPKIVSNWMMGELTARLNSSGIEADQCAFTPDHLAELLQMIDEGLISGKLAKDVLDQSFSTGISPRTVVDQENLTQISDHGELEAIIGRLILEHPDSVENYRAGKTKALGFLVGQVMKETRGKANPQLVNELLLKALET